MIDASEEYVKKLKHGNLSERALAVAFQYAGIDGAHHKDWCIDQMVRILAGAGYDEFVEMYSDDGEYEWDEGIAP